MFRKRVGSEVNAGATNSVNAEIVLIFFFFKKNFKAEESCVV